ncbi:MAG TPA: DUF4112 domain-containing protein [Candidatus Binatia bacterium]
MAIRLQHRIDSRTGHEADRLWFAKFLADLLDQRFTIPGTSIRIGLDPIIGLIPGIGDLIANLTGSLILIVAAQLGVPKVILVRMGINIAINTMIGAIPIFGDIISIWYRSNVRNVALLQRYLGEPSKKAVFRDWLFVVGLIAGLLALMVGIVVAVVWVFKQLWDIL